MLALNGIVPYVLFYVSSSIYNDLAFMYTSTRWTSFIQKFEIHSGIAKDMSYQIKTDVPKYVICHNINISQVFEGCILYINKKFY